MANIRSIENYHNSFWDWGFLNNCFINGIKVSDLDGIIERHGFFLVLEAKQPNAGQSNGQRKLFEELVKTGRFTVIYFWGESNKPETITHIEILKPKVWGNPSKVETTGKKASSKKNLVEIIRNWFFKANANYPRDYVN